MISTIKLETTTKELSLCHILKFIIFISLKLSLFDQPEYIILKKLRTATLGCKETGIRKSESVANQSLKTKGLPPPISLHFYDVNLYVSKITIYQIAEFIALKSKVYDISVFKDIRNKKLESVVRNNFLFYYFVWVLVFINELIFIFYCF